MNREQQLIGMLNALCMTGLGVLRGPMRTQARALHRQEIERALAWLKGDAPPAPAPADSAPADDVEPRRLRRDPYRDD